MDEPLLPETIAKAGKRLRASSNPADAVAPDASFFIVPWPSLSDGSFPNEFLLRAHRTGRWQGEGKPIFVISSTPTPGACRSVIIPMFEKEVGGKCG